MTTSSFIFSLAKEIEGYIQEAVASIVGMQLAIKIGYDVDINKVMKRIYKNLVKAQESLNQLYEVLENESEREKKVLDDFERLANELELINNGDSNGC
jgi:septation ring formation regulator EzrA